MIDYFVVIVLIIFSALFSGLTLGLMGLNKQELKRKVSLGDKQAIKVYEVRRQGNLLLTTLLIGNVAVNATLSIFLGSITSGVMAGLVATTLIVVFGEISPQAVFSRFALFLGAKTAWIVKIFIFVLYPIAKPISVLLDKLLGEELPTIYSKKELMKIIEEHEDHKASDVSEEEEKIVKGALTFSDEMVIDVMTPRTVLNTLDLDEEITCDIIMRLKRSGNSRVPVYKGNLDNVVGILYVKQLIGGDVVGKKVSEFTNMNVFFIDQNQKLDIVLEKFLKTHNHLFVVRNEFSEVTGIITLEDILEEIIGEEIVDEEDVHNDMRKFARSKSGK